MGASRNLFLLIGRESRRYQDGFRIDVCSIVRRGRLDEEAGEEEGEEDTKVKVNERTRERTSEPAIPRKRGKKEE